MFIIIYTQTGRQTCEGDTDTHSFPGLASTSRIYNSQRIKFMAKVYMQAQGIKSP